MEIDALSVVNTILILGIVFVMAGIPYLNHTLTELRQRNAESRRALCKEIGLPENCLVEASPKCAMGNGPSKAAKDVQR